ncbi:hypothetical protein BA953_24065 [Vibrio coralliilyticus]|uniref:hypothetical protein n=1 Tax=Vibrio coralliilyticus TaxID=190893 RepID=UPI000810EF66|nr:hypothetical protein [Vibrio coralliilyticus]ANW27196.1 hypothetical protein BA953_24065 [Vibrio coralliilyticus]
MKSNLLIFITIMLLISFTSRADSESIPTNYNDAQISLSEPISFGTKDNGYVTQEVINRGDSPAFVVTSILEKVGDEDKEVSSKEIIVVPSNLVIPPKSKKLVRTIVMEGYDDSTYREFFVNFKPLVPLYEGSEGLNVHISFSQYIGLFNGSEDSFGMNVNILSEKKLEIENLGSELVIYNIRACKSESCSSYIFEHGFSLIRPGENRVYDSEYDVYSYDSIEVEYQYDDEIETKILELK